MIPDFSKKMSIGEALGPAMEITNPNEAKEYFEALVKAAIKDGKSREEAEKITKANLGYYSGYYNEDVQLRVQKLFNCVHPVFGAIEGSKKITPKEAFEKGVEMAERHKKGLPLINVEQPKNPRKVARKILID